MNRITIWKQFEGKSKETQNRIYRQVMGSIKESGRRNVRKEDDLVMNEIINQQEKWSKEL